MESVKDNKIIVAQRRYAIEKLVLSGLPHREIIDKMSEEYKKSRAQIVADISKIYKKWKKKNYKNINVNYNTAVKRLTAIYQKAWESGDLRIAKDTIDTLNKLQGLYEVRLNITDNRQSELVKSLDNLKTIAVMPVSN